jgi:hypothetical protein
MQKHDKYRHSSLNSQFNLPIVPLCLRMQAGTSRVNLKALVWVGLPRNIGHTFFVIIHVLICSKSTGD